MKIKILAAIVIILALVLVGETVYLFSARRPITKPVAMHKGPKPLPKQQTSALDRKFWEPYTVPFKDIGEWDPLKEMERIQKKINQEFKESFNRGFQEQRIDLSQIGLGFEPSMDIEGMPSQYLVTVELPGLNKQNVNLEVKDNRLTISGEKKIETTNENKKIYRQERKYGAFTSSVILPEDADTKNIYAKYDNGVLEIRIPRMAIAEKQARPSENIKIN